MTAATRCSSTLPRKYGDDKVAQIITFGTLGARAAIRDVGRVMDIPLPRGRSDRQADPQHPRQAGHHPPGAGGAGRFQAALPDRDLPAGADRHHGQDGRRGAQCRHANLINPDSRRARFLYVVCPPARPLRILAARWLQQPQEAGRARQEMGMPAIALTDHGTMFGVIEFFNAAQAAGIKPIIGLETYMAARSMSERDPQEDKKSTTCCCWPRTRPATTTCCRSPAPPSWRASTIIRASTTTSWPRMPRG